MSIDTVTFGRSDYYSHSQVPFVRRASECSISVAYDDDVHHMIDECLVLEESKERPTIYLSTDEDDEHHVHFVVGSSSDKDFFPNLLNGE